MRTTKRSLANQPSQKEYWDSHLLQDPLTLGIIINVAAVLMGAVGRWFNPFIEKRQEYRNRASLLQKNLLEQVSMRNVALLQHLRNNIDLTDFELRGDGRETPDLVHELTLRIFRSSEILSSLLFWSNAVKRCYQALFILTAAPFFLIFFALLADFIRTIFPYIGIAILTIQVLIVMILIQASFSLDEYERFQE